MPGVLITPANSTVACPACSPAARSAAMCGPDSRVSIPIRTCADPWPFCRNSASPRPTVFRIAGAGTSLRILAGAVILLFFYYAAGVVITLLLSVLLAYFLDPAVELLERVHVPRTIGALIMVLLLIGVLGAVGYALWVRTEDFAANWHTYRDILREAAGSVQGKLRGIT